MSKAPLAPILTELERLYPDAECTLDYRDAWQLLVATILSAQSTDARVNQVTPALFARFPTVRDVADAELPELEQAIRTIGIFRNKAKNLRAAAQLLMAEYGGRVPRTMTDLQRLPGVARKTANVVMGTAWGIAEGIAVDTHVSRVAWRLGLAQGKGRPERIERELMERVQREQWIVLSHRLILHGRRVCLARSPRCEACTLRKHCRHFQDH